MNSDENFKDNTLSSIERKVLQVITVFNRPVSAEEIAYEMGMPKDIVLKILENLVNKGNVVIYQSKIGDQTYYTPLSSKSGLDSVLSQKYADMAAGLEKKYLEVRSENDILKAKIEQFYSNIITIMGVFIALFALIVINIEAIGMFVSDISDSSDLFWSLLKLNIPIIITIAVLLVLIKLLFRMPRKR